MWFCLGPPAPAWSPTLVLLEDIFQGGNTSRGNGPLWELSFDFFSSSPRFLLLKEVLAAQSDSEEAEQPELPTSRA